MEKLYVGLEMANKWSDPPMVIMGCAFLGIPGLIYTSYLAACYLVRPSRGRHSLSALMPTLDPMHCVRHLHNAAASG